MVSSAAATSKRPLQIGMVGGGTVGGGVYEILMGNSGTSGQQLPHLRRPCIITKICVQSLSKPRSFHLDSEMSQLVTDVNSILDDDNIDMVVEVMGGTEKAKQVVLACLKRRKAVISANKVLIAEHLNEISKAVRENPGSQFFYEAAVCGGIPIIQVLNNCYTGDVIHQVMVSQPVETLNKGIANGTTNYMLEKMKEGADFCEVLREAHELGFAESDPTADVEGHDVRAKIAIMAKLAFGVTVAPESVPCKGITEITSIDFEYSKILNTTIKLVGVAGRMSRFGEYDGALSVYVTPVMIPNKHLLASVRGSGNAIAVESANMGTCLYTGPGAGRFPTANSVVADIVRAANNTIGLGAVDPKDAVALTEPPFPLQSTIDLDCDYTRSFYVRIPFMDSVGIIRRLGELAEVHDVSIHSILQNPIVDRMEADFCLTTEECKLSQVQALCHDLETQDFVRGPPLFMPLLWA